MRACYRVLFVSLLLRRPHVSGAAWILPATPVSAARRPDVVVPLPSLVSSSYPPPSTALYSKKSRRGGGGGAGGGGGYSSSEAETESPPADDDPSAVSDELKRTGEAVRSTLQLAKSVLESPDAERAEKNGADELEWLLGGSGNTNTDRELAKLGREDDDDDDVQNSQEDDDARQRMGTASLNNGRSVLKSEAEEEEASEDDQDVMLAWDIKAASVTVEADDEATHAAQGQPVVGTAEDRGPTNDEDDSSGSPTENEKEELHQQRQDEVYLRMAIQMAESVAEVAYPHPPVGAVLVDVANGEVLGVGSSERHYHQDAIRVCLLDAGLDVTPLRDWLVAWPSDRALREALDAPTTALYVTLEPTHERSGQAFPSLTNLIQQAGIRRVVIGCVDPVPDKSGKGAAALHAAGIDVRLLPAGSAVQQECYDLVNEYRLLANSKLHGQARKHFELFGRPLGFLHCSVVDSDNVEAFQRAGNAFGTQFGGKTLSFRNFGAYEIAPPPEVIWAADDDSMDAATSLPAASSTADANELISVDFEDENYQGDWSDSTPMMPWYEQANAVVATFPRPGNGPTNDASLAARLNGLKWLATHGKRLPGGVERILVMDATDLEDLPLTNAALARHFPNSEIDVEAFWRGADYGVNHQGGVRRPTRVLLRRGAHAQARSAAEAAAIAAAAAAKAAQTAAEALETGDAAQAAEAALEMEQAANSRARYIQSQLQTVQELRLQLEQMGVAVETIQGGEPVDVMKHLGDRNGYQIVVWRAGCWGDRGVKAILAGAFQWVSAHLAVDAVGGKFWQLMLAENAVQAACGPQSKVKVFADQEDISLEYCDNPDVDTDCNLLIAGRPVRHIRLDCRVALVDENRHREFVVGKTKKIDRKIIEEEAPWFL